MLHDSGGEEQGGKTGGDSLSRSLEKSQETKATGEIPTHTQGHQAIGQRLGSPEMLAF